MIEISMMTRRKARLHALAGHLFAEGRTRDLIADEGSFNLVRKHNRELRKEAKPLQELIKSYDLIVDEVMYPASPSADIDLQHQATPLGRPRHEPSPLELQVHPSSSTMNSEPCPPFITYSTALPLGTFKVGDLLTAYILPAMQKKYVCEGSKIPFSVTEEHIVYPGSKEYPSEKVWIPRKVEEYERAIVLVKHEPQATYIDNTWLRDLGLEYRENGTFKEVSNKRV